MIMEWASMPVRADSLRNVPHPGYSFISRSDGTFGQVAGRAGRRRLALETLDLKQVREQVQRALEVERPLLAALRDQVRGFGIHDIAYRQRYENSPVATDGCQT